MKEFRSNNFSLSIFSDNSALYQSLRSKLEIFSEREDILILKEWDPTTKDYTGREIRKKVTQVGHLNINDEKFWSKEQIDKFGFHIISIE